MARDFFYAYEMMPSETDEEFVAMVAMATRENTMTNVWMPRLVALARDGARFRKYNGPHNKKPRAARGPAGLD